MNAKQASSSISSTERDAQRYRKLRTLAEFGHSLHVYGIATAASFDERIDSVDMGRVCLFKKIQEFAELVVLLLNDVDSGFGDAVNFGGTGIYQDGIAWRNIFGIRKSTQSEIKNVVKRALSYPEFSTLTYILDTKKVFIEVEHEEEASVRLGFNAAAYSMLNSLPEFESRLFYGDLEVMTSPQ